MKLLAVETSTMLGGIALMEGDTLIGESRINVKVTHSERIMTEIDHLLTRSGWTIDDVDVFGAASGPGSFTGLRVGLSTVKGLVYATGKRLVSVPTLEAFAWNIPFAAHRVCPLFDARRKEVYAGLYQWSETGFIKVMEERALKLEELLAGISEPVIFIGEAAVLHRELIRETLGGLALFGAPQQMVPSPANVAYLCMKKAEEGLFEDPIRLVPRYLRKSEAEIKFGLRG